MKISVDIETRSRVDLKKYGVYRYVTCPDFRILMAGWRVNGEGPVSSDLTQEEAVERFRFYWEETDAIFKAHNAPFERVCFSAALGLPPGEYLDPERFDDPQAKGAELGYPKKLEKMAPALGAQPKDAAGTRLINLFSKPNRKGGWNGPETHPLEWLDFVAYMEQDVYTMDDIDERLEAQGGWPNETERRLYMVDQRINDRGLAIDVPMAQQAVKVGAVNTSLQTQRVRSLAKVDNPNSIPQMQEWAKREGLDMPNFQAETVEKVLRGDLTADQREVLELRQELALAAPGKFSSALETHVEGRLRGTLGFFGAHTGRWAGRGTQPHNLPRASFYPEGEDFERIKMMKDLGMDYEAEIVRVIEEMTRSAIVDLMVSEYAPASTLKKLVRALFILNGCVVDYAAIEARVIAWLADEQWALKAFREGRDIYVETANRMGGLSRSQGKIAVLALGYNGGSGSLRAMANEGDEIHRLSDDVLYERYVYPWREANARIVKMWADLERAFRTGGKVGQHLRFEKDGSDRLLILPSGRAICYRKCGVTRSGNRERLSYASPQGFRMDLYGGRIAENVTQAVARDLLGEALIRLEDRGYNVVAHVHDEVLVEGAHDWHEISRIMCELPTWAKGLPVDGDGFVTERYRKG